MIGTPKERDGDEGKSPRSAKQRLAVPVGGAAWREAIAEQAMHPKRIAGLPPIRASLRRRRHSAAGRARRLESQLARRHHQAAPIKPTAANIHDAGSGMGHAPS